MKGKLYGAAAVAVLVAGASLLSASLRPPAAEQAIQPVHETAAGRIFAPGRVEGQTPEVVIHATITERITRVCVAEGEHVCPGQVIVQLDDRSLLAEERLAEAGLRLAQTGLERLVNGARESEIEEARSIYRARAAEFDGATLALDRIIRLGSGGAASAQSVDNAQVRVQSSKALMQAAGSRLLTLELPPRADEIASSKAEIAAAQARLELAQAMRSRAAILAPAAGMVLQVNVEAGELASPAVPLIVMCDTSRLRVRADVEELDALRVAAGQLATVRTDGLPDAVLQGIVSHVRPRLNDKRIHSDRPGERLDSRSREVWIDFITQPDLVIGLPVDVWILPSRATAVETQQAAVIPSAATR